MMIRLVRDWATSGSWKIYVFDVLPDGAIPYKITLERLDPVGITTAMTPSLLLPAHQQAQVISALMEGLSDAGLIPKMGATEAELVATKRHLEDMRTAFAELVRRHDQDQASY